jgi:hypothetical protein
MQKLRAKGNGRQTLNAEMQRTRSGAKSRIIGGMNTGFGISREKTVDLIFNFKFENPSAMVALHKI